MESLVILVSSICIITFSIRLYIGMQRLYTIQEKLENTTEEKDVLLDFLHIITEDVAKGANKDAIYRRLVRATALSCGAMSACFYERVNDKLVPVAVEGLFPPLQRKIPKFKTRSQFLECVIAHKPMPMDSGIIADVYKTSEAVFIKKAMYDSRIIQHEDDSIKIKSFIAVPVTFAGEKYGVLVLTNPISNKSFTSTIFSLAKTLGEQGGLALYNLDGIAARVVRSQMDNDLRLASSVQHYLLPEKLPTNEKFSTAVTYKPQLLIGGDFYDTIKLEGGKTGIVIADASGNGVPAAMLMAVAQSKLHYIAKMGMSPAQTLIKLNAELVRSMSSDMFITITFAIIDSDANTITIARAGHELPIIYKAKEGKCVEIKSSGMAVGMVESEIFDEMLEDITIPFEKNDVFILYTDGATEATNSKGEEFTTARLITEIEINATSPVKEINESIFNAVKNFAHNNRLSDDLTLLSIKKN